MKVQKADAIVNRRETIQKLKEDHIAALTNAKSKTVKSKHFAKEGLLDKDKTKNKGDLVTISRRTLREEIKDKDFMYLIKPSVY